ncbi:MAG: TraX family protein [Acetivibrio sp.]
MQENTRKRGLSEGVLKAIAMLAMLIDNAAVIILSEVLKKGMLTAYPVETWYKACRMFGRIAFPIFCFLLVEGFFYTKNRVKYVAILAITAAISEIPFNLAFYKTLGYSKHQNVFFTLFIGLLMVFAIQEFREKILPKITKHRNMLALLVQLAIILGGGFLANFIGCEYGFLGIIALMGIYILRFNKSYLCICEALYFLATRSIQSMAALAFIPIWFYNGKRGKMEYLLPIFYPLQLLLLYGIYRIVL